MPDAPTRSRKDLFLAASEIADARERARFLDESCAGDAALRARVEELLHAGMPANFLEASPVAAALEESLPQRGDAIGYFGDYILLSEIARGATGVVFRARQVSLNRVVALKMLRDRAHLASMADEKRFRAEAEAAAGLDHPGIVPIYEVGQHEGQGYFSMKLIEGGTLLFRGGEFRAPRRAAALIAKVARAVHHAHRHGILHRDLKPGNILLDGDDEPHVVDFGIARRIGLDSELTQTGQIVGTPHYMSPEQARGENRALTPAADIYGLGAILYELLSGKKPFDADTMLALLRQVTEQPPAPLRLGDRDLENIVMRCLEKSPAARYGSASEFADDLDRWLRSEPVLARPAGIVSHLAKWARRRPAHAALAALVVCGVAFAAHVLLDTRPASTVSSTASAQPPAPAPQPPAPAPTKPAVTAAIPVNADPTAARRALEWLHSVNSPAEGYVTIQGSDGKSFGIHPDTPLPPGDFVIVELWLDRYNAPPSLPPLTSGDFRKHAATLRHLRMCFLRTLDLTAADLAFLAENPNLAELKIENMGIGDGLIPHIAGLGKLRQIVMVSNAGKGDELTGHGFDTLACLPILEVANLYGSRIDDTAIAILAGRCPRLGILHLDNTLITDDALRSLNHRAFNRLSIGRNPGITDIGLAELAKIPAINEVDVHESRNVTSTGIEAFQKAHPKCLVRQ